jgi:hypothetical protein
MINSPAIISWRGQVKREYLQHKFLVLANHRMNLLKRARFRRLTQFFIFIFYIYIFLIRPKLKKKKQTIKFNYFFYSGKNDFFLKKNNNWEDNENFW